MKNILKTKSVALLACLLFAGVGAQAQLQPQRHTLPVQRVSLSQQTLTLGDLFREIRRQTGTTIMFDADNAALSRQVAVPAYRGFAEDLLAAVLPSQGYAWRATDDYIIVHPVGEAAMTLAPAQQRYFDQQRALQQSVNQTTVATTQQNAPAPRYDTIRTVHPHSGTFDYPSRIIMPRLTGRTTSTEFARNTPPMLAVKTNIVGWAAMGTANLAGEIGLGRHTTLEVAGQVNRWNLNGTVANNKKMVHWSVKPEFRYWLCECFNGHFFGVHAFYSQYNVGGYDIPMLFEKEWRYEGDAYGVGLNYGYHLPLAKRWGLEFNVGVGMAQLKYDKSDCIKCGLVEGNYSKTYFGPTQLGVKLTFQIR